MKQVWIMSSWCYSGDTEGDNILGVYDDFEFAADVALKEIHRLKHDVEVHTELECQLETSFADGQAQYTLNTRMGDNPFYPSDVIELNRYDVNTRAR